ncbi:MAG TPA: transporter [Saprospiraceae bacterium]|nr:transporter [Saprospiraceae bacterium]HQW25490.1 transporter [Saprospiraceae bacterium]
MYKLFTILILGAIGFSTDIFGQADSTMIADSMPAMDPIRADRPDQTESSFLVPKGYFQVEMGFSITDTDPGFIYAYPAGLWKYGLTDNFELRLITQYITIQKEPNPNVNGFLPLAAGFKARLSEQKGVLPKMSFLGHLRLPGVVSEEFETTYLAPDLRLAFDHIISDVFSVGYIIGLVWDGEDPEPFVIYTLTTGLAISKRLGLFAEVYGATPQRSSEELELYADAGLTYLIGNNFLLDVSASQGITDNAPLSYVSAGFSYRFKL